MLEQNEKKFNTNLFLEIKALYVLNYRRRLEQQISIKKVRIQ